MADGVRLAVFAAALALLSYGVWLYHMPGLRERIEAEERAMSSESSGSERP